MSKILHIIAGLFLLSVFTGCATTLSPTGVYQGDTVLYNADIVFNTATTTVDQFLKYELANRGTPAAPKGLTQAADKIRGEWPRIHDAYYSARDLYTANKSAANLSSFQKAITDAQGALSIASGFLTSAQPKAP